MLTLKEHVVGLLNNIMIGIDVAHLDNWDAGQIHSAASFAIQTAMAATTKRPRPIRMPAFLCQFPTLTAKPRKKVTKKGKR